MQFQYRAVNPEGGTVAGTVEAESRLQALILIGQRGLKPFWTEEQSKARARFQLFPSMPNAKWRGQFYQELSTLLTAGIGVDRAVGIIATHTSRARERKLLELVHREIASGGSLSFALETHGNGFKPEELGLVKAGEQSGSLARSLESLRLQLQRQVEVQSKIQSALIYPLFLLLLAPVSLAIIATVLVPNLAPLFEDTKTPMPFALAAMIAISYEIKERGLVWLFVMLFSVFALFRLSRTDRVRKLWEQLRLKLPVIGALVHHSETARFAQVLGILIQSGAPLQTALLYAGEAMPTKFTRQQVLSARNMIVEGANLTKALGGVASLQRGALQLISIGEETNQLGQILKHISEIETRALETRIERLMVLLTPLLTILLGLLIGGIVMSIMRAILSINQLAAQ